MKLSGSEVLFPEYATPSEASANSPRGSVLICANPVFVLIPPRRPRPVSAAQQPAFVDALGVQFRKNLWPLPNRRPELSFWGCQQSFRNWTPSEGNGAGTHVLDTMRVITGQIYTYGNSGSNSGALAFNQSTTAVQGGSESYGGTLRLNSSNLGERYAGVETAPQHVWHPLCLYLGRPS